MSALEHLVQTHDMRLVLVAAAVCLLGGWATSRFFPRIVATSGGQRVGWAVLTALTCGVSVWCTHFISMLAHTSSSAVTLDEPLTLLSLGIAILGIGVGLTIAAARPSRLGAVLGGLVVGAAIAGMHYTGIAAYRAEGEVTWDGTLVALSILFSLAAPAAAMLAARRGDSFGRNAQWLLLSLAIVLLHFTGMAAFTVATEHEHGHIAGAPNEMQMLVVFIAALGFVVVTSGVAGYLIDDRNRAEGEEQLRTLASFDPLTQLPNRTGFTERLELELTEAREHGQRFALLSIDLHGVKGVNDRRGYSIGDEVLRAAGRRLAGLAGDAGDVFVARVGGDEFAAIVRSGRGLDGFLVELERSLTSDFTIAPGSAEHLPGAAIGVAVYPDDARTAEDLIAGADLAMDRSKSDPLQRPRFYDRMDDQRTRTRRELAADLRGADERGELRLRYQPQAEVDGRRVLGYEALVHWEHPTRGPIFREELMPLAEESGLAAVIGEWVLRAACREAATWDPGHRVSVDVSVQRLGERGLISVIRDVLAGTGLEPSRLEIEVTEAEASTDCDRALATLRGIGALGVGIALDRFGTGHSSLAVLRAFRFDRITIDRSIIDAETESGRHQAREIVTAISGLGRALGMRVLAEGVESERQLDMLREAGVTEAQGPLLGRPTPPERIVKPAPIAG